MESFDLEIKEKKKAEDFTIIYKGPNMQKNDTTETIKEIKTIKEDFFGKLRYFKPKVNEFKQINEIYIHDIYPVDIFEEFIQSIQTFHIRLNPDNFESFYNLSKKYEFEELQEELDQYSKDRPDLKQIITKMTVKNDDQIDSQKEEIISKHLDICLKNEEMIRIPLPTLIRILNSPNRILTDHHLLFQFIQKVIDFNQNNSNENLDEKRDYYQLLFNSIDYIELDNDELECLFQNEFFSNIKGMKNFKERISLVIEERNLNVKRITDLEDKFIQHEKLHQQDKNDLEAKFSQHEKLHQQEKNDLEANFCQHEKLHQQEKNDLENKIKKIEEKLGKMNDKLTKQGEIIDNYRKLEQVIQSQEAKLNKQEEIIQKIQLHVEITAKVEQDETIKGEIRITDYFKKLDKARSRYILNTDSSSTLSEDSYREGKPISNLVETFSFGKPLGIYYLHALVVDSEGHKREAVSQPITTKGKPLTFEYTGKVQSATLGAGRYKLEVWGSEGGKCGSYIKSGKGGYSVGTINLKEKTTLYVFVGESPTSTAGGWNGGGSGRGSAAGGGGSTDISLSGEDGSTNWNNSNHLYSRIIVAGAGGGSGNCDDYYGGYGGGDEGQSSRYGPSENGGTQTRAGTNNSYSTNQGFGIGGNHTGSGSSGGGGGWYGGGASDNGGVNTGGAGGSGYVYNSATAKNYPGGCLLNEDFYLVESSTHAGNTSFPSPTGTSNETGHTGNGYAKISFL